VKQILPSSFSPSLVSKLHEDEMEDAEVGWRTVTERVQKDRPSERWVME
jgi:hypothetical protein